MKTTQPAREIVFLPGFDGAAGLRMPFVRALGTELPSRAIAYPNRTLGSLNGYCRYAASQAAPGMRHVLVAESFSGLVAARWASRDPHVDALVLCGSFARNPVRWAASLGASLPGVVQFGARIMRAIPPATLDPVRLAWSRSFNDAMIALDTDVIAERLQIIAQEDVSHDLATLNVPIILMQFDRDQVVGHEARSDLEAVCHNAHIVRFPGPHFALEVQPKECAEALGGKLRSILGRRTA